MNVRGLMMVGIQVRDFDEMVAWYRDALGLEVQWFEAGEFCTLLPRGSDGPALLANVLRWQMDRPWQTRKTW